MTKEQILKRIEELKFDLEFLKLIADKRGMVENTKAAIRSLRTQLQQLEKA